MKIATVIARVLLGLVFFVFGLNGFLHFIPLPDLPGPAKEFMGALVKTGYMIPLIKSVEVACGALLLSGYFVPLALVLLAPGLVNIFLFHAMLTPPKDLVGPVIYIALELFLMWRYREYYRTVFTARARPA